MKVFKGINFAGLASDPASPTNGDIYYNTVSNSFRVYVNGGWTDLADLTSSQTLTNKTIDATNNTISNIANANIAAAAAIAYSKLDLADSIVDADINSAAAIAYSKLALSDSIVNADINSAAAIAYSKLDLADSIVDSDINSAAAIAYSKLALTDSIVNADIATAAAIAYSKLDLADSIVDADINSAAAISGTKINPDFGSQDITTAGDLVLEDAQSPTPNYVKLSAPAALSSNQKLILPSGAASLDKTLVVDSVSGEDITLTWGDASGQATVIITQASHGFAVGDVLYLNGTVYTKANASDPESSEVVGIVSEIIDANDFKLTSSGVVDNLTSSNFVEAALPSEGDVIFLSTTDGKMSVSEPTSAGEISLPLGVAKTTSSMYVQLKRGFVVGSNDITTELTLTNNATSNIQDVSAYKAGELTGWVTIDADTNYRFYLQVQFAENGDDTDYNIAYQTTGDTPPTGFSVSVTSAGLIQLTLPNLSGFTSATINYALNAPAVGVTLPLSIDASKITTGTLDTARIDADSVLNATSLGIGSKNITTAATYNGTPPVDNILTAPMLSAGAIVEYGSNADGEYTKYESGLLICSYIGRHVMNGGVAVNARFTSANLTAPMPVTVSTSSGSPDLVTWITPTSFVTFANIAQVGFRRSSSLTVMEGDAPGFSFPANQLTHRFYNRGGGFSSGNADGIGMSFLGIGTWK